MSCPLFADATPRSAYLPAADAAGSFRLAPVVACPSPCLPRWPLLPRGLPRLLRCAAKSFAASRREPAPAAEISAALFRLLVSAACCAALTVGDAKAASASRATKKAPIPPPVALRARAPALPPVLGLTRSVVDRAPSPADAVRSSLTPVPAICSSLCVMRCVCG